MKIEDVQQLINQNKDLILSKSLLNCRVRGLHSFILKQDEDGNLIRMFVTDETHELGRNYCPKDPKDWEILSVAIHPHHVDIQINMIFGQIRNVEFTLTKPETFYAQKRLRKYIWQSQIVNGQGGFKQVGKSVLYLKNRKVLKEGSSTKMNSCELHTVHVWEKQVAAWIIVQSEQSCGYDNVNYSNADLESWTANGLYQKPTPEQITTILGSINLIF